VETPTVVAFYENEDFTGASYSVGIKPTSVFEAVRIVSTNELAAAGLRYTISSVRLACGTRPSRVSLFDIDWSESSDGTALECSPNETVTINLAAQTVPAYGGFRDLNDKVGAAVITAHVRSSDDDVHSNEFSFLLGQKWKTVMNSLKDATHAWTSIWQEDLHSVRLRQALEVDHYACTARDAIFELRITMATSNFRPVFNVHIIEEWVSSGFGDGWPFHCRDRYLSVLHSRLLDAKSEIQSGLPQLFQGTSSATHYFVPEFGTRLFQAFYWQ
jgi:hypothetical protein